jgi:DNA-directed RNA polymerase subunit N (RpoN/RPB10)
MTDPNGTPIKCLHCGKETTVRLSKGRCLKQMLCIWCGNKGFRRWTEFDKWIINQKNTEVQK